MAETMTDRERILVNIAAELACELAHLQNLPIVRDYMARSNVRVLAEYGGFGEATRYEKSDLVVCRTSTGRQQNPWLVSFVAERGTQYDPQGLLLRAIGTDALCNYGNESFIRIRGIADRLLWEGDQHQFALKVHKALRKLDNYMHCFRGLEFDKDKEGNARLYIGERWGGALADGKGSKPYIIDLTFTKQTTIKAIIAQMKAQGFGTRAFEPNDGTYTGPMQGFTTITRDDLVTELNAAGFSIKDNGRSVSESNEAK